MKKTVKMTISDKIYLIGTQHRNQNWRVIVKDKQTNEELEVDRSVTQTELKYLFNHMLEWNPTTNTTMKDIKNKLKDIIHSLIALQ